MMSSSDSYSSSDDSSTSSSSSVVSDNGIESDIDEAIADIKDLEPEDLIELEEITDEALKEKDNPYGWSASKPLTEVVVNSTAATDQSLRFKMKEEFRSIERRVKKILCPIQPNLTMDVLLKFVFEPLLQTIVEATRDTVSHKHKDPVMKEDVSHYIRVLAILSVYHKSHSIVLDTGNSNLYHIARFVEKKCFVKVLKCLNSKKCESDHSSTRWDAPMEDDKNMRECERVLVRVFSNLCFVKDITICSIDDDLNRLRSALCQTYGLQRIRIEGK